MTKDLLIIIRIKIVYSYCDFFYAVHIQTPSSAADNNTLPSGVQQSE